MYFGIVGRRRKKTLQFVWILLHLVLHMAIFYFKMAKEICGKRTYIYRMFLI